jgi:hypothetical protein
LGGNGPIKISQTVGYSDAGLKNPARNKKSDAVESGADFSAKSIKLGGNGPISKIGSTDFSAKSVVEMDRFQKLDPDDSAKFQRKLANSAEFVNLSQ